ncbi:uncharacterized protein LOC121388091 [Gigantopelta aegis]|uniref:uncharacterized protein LOC121388091 n=1 Tax=Gigantopelta aegis TaxID=1735272 RepID=UPI001B88B9AB|nr:uncharacterized protein LOC121388091 [Gigantopelta aegis]
MGLSVINCEVKFCDSVHGTLLNNGQVKSRNTVSRSYPDYKDIDNGQTTSQSSSTSSNESDVPLIKEEKEENVVINQNVENKDKEDGLLWRNLIIIFGVLNLLWISAIVVFYFKIIPPTDIRTRHVFTEVHDDGDFCVPCDAVYLTEDDVHDNINHFEKRDDDCCVGKKSTLTNIVTKFADKQYRQLRARDFDSGRPDETHIELNDRSAELRQLDVDQSELRQLDVDQSGGIKLRWKRALSSIGRNITYVHDAGLQVNVAGLYHIYSRLVFVDDGKDTAGRNVSYFIWLRRPGKEDEKLLDSVSSECEMTSSANGVIPSFQSGTFVLEAGDIVEMRVDNMTHVHKSGSNSLHYFGLYYI